MESVDGNKKFLNLTPSECRKVYPGIMKNANEFYRSGNHLAGLKFYGKAISLLILGAEEYLKCLCIFLDGYGCNTRNISQVKNIFSKHSSRLKVSRDFLSVWAVAKYLVSFKITNSARENLAIYGKEVLNIFTAQFQYDWWNDANMLKQNGLYADYNNSLWLPAMLTSADYDRAKSYTDEVPKIMRSLINHVSSLNKKELNEFRENFKIAEFDQLIQEALQRKE